VKWNYRMNFPHIICEICEIIIWQQHARRPRIGHDFNLQFSISTTKRSVSSGFNLLANDLFIAFLHESNEFEYTEDDDEQQPDQWSSSRVFSQLSQLLKVFCWVEVTLFLPSYSSYNKQTVCGENDNRKSFYSRLF
jgi:hypothetical protein